MGNPDDDKEFEKFLMASISGSEGTSALTSARNLQSSGGKNLEWNLTSSEDLSPRRSRFLKTDDSKNLGGLLEDVLKSSVSEPAEEKGESLDESTGSSDNSPDNRNQGGAFGGVTGGDQSPDLEIFQKNNINFLSSSLTETNQTETDDRQEFANRLAQQHSALQSLGKAIPENQNNDNEEIRGTLEGLEEMKEVIEQVKSESQKSSTKEDQVSPNQESADESILKSESVFSDASKSELSESVANESELNESVADDSVPISESYSVTESTSTTKNDAKNESEPNEMSEKLTETESKTEVGSGGTDVKSSDGFDVEKTEDEDSLNESIKAPLYATDLSPAVIPSPGTNDQPLPTDTIIVSKNPTDDSPVEEGGITITGEKDETDSIENNEKLDKLFGTHKVNAIDILDDDEADLSATKEISLAESSLVEMLNIYESKKNERSIENEFQVHIPESENASKTFKKPLPKKETAKAKKTIELKKKAPSPKSTVHKPMDWSHVKGSGYGPSATSKRESRPKISPRLHQKVENVKRERIAQINKRQRKSKK